MKTLTRKQLGDILSANMATKTIHANITESNREIADNWIVVFLENDENGILNIYCEAPKV
jgi:hypothetical protein